MKHTLNTNEVKSGDYVVGFNQKVQTVEIKGAFVKVTFESGRVWNTNRHFVTTVIR